LRLHSRLPRRAVFRRASLEETRVTATTRRWLRQLGPGLITGAADDDPSGIAPPAELESELRTRLRIGGPSC